MHVVLIMMIALIVILVLVGITRSNWARQATVTISRALGRDVTDCDSACAAAWSVALDKAEICSSIYCKYVYAFDEMKNSRFEPADTCFPDCTVGSPAECVYGEHLANLIDAAHDSGSQPYTTLDTACVYLAENASWPSQHANVSNCGANGESCTSLSSYCMNPCSIYEWGNCDENSLYAEILEDCEVGNGQTDVTQCDLACLELYGTQNRHGGEIVTDCSDEAGLVYWCAQMEDFASTCQQCSFDVWYLCETAGDMLDAINEAECNLPE